MKITDFNKQDYTVYTINTEGFEYKNLASVEDVVVRGFFINTKTAYGEQPVMITDNCYVNLPKHLLDDIKHIIKDDEITKDINSGKVRAERYSYIGSDKKEYYSVRWIYNNGDIS